MGLGLGWVGFLDFFSLGHATENDIAVHSPDDRK